MEIRPAGSELFHADGLTDMTNLIVAFCISSETPKNGGYLSLPSAVMLLAPICLSAVDRRKSRSAF